jgi:uncharacterized protein (UPF0548 family)
MLALQKPSDETLRHFLTSQSEQKFSYNDVGATSSSPPAGFVTDQTRIVLGAGESIFLEAKSAIQSWRQFQLGWVNAWPLETPIKPGEIVSVAGRAFGLWWLNSCRIIYVINESGPIHRFGFAYGTLPKHVERGEERFLIEWDQSADTVCYDILAFSQPNYFITRLGYPLVRRMQKRFGRDSAKAVFRAVNQIDPIPQISQWTIGG